MDEPISFDYINNLQDQGDELDALEAIYCDEFMLHHRANSVEDQTPTSLEVILPIEIPMEGVQFQLHSTANEKEDSQQIGSMLFHYLPPLSIVFNLPKEYPGNGPPKFVITCKWLTKRAIGRVCEQFDLLCEMDSGAPMLFTLCNWMQFDSIRYLVSESGILELKEIQEDEEGDDRAVSQCCSLEDTVTTLMQYNRKYVQEEYYKGNHTCDLCLEELPGSEFQLLSCCEKGFCVECLSDMCKRLVKSGELYLLNCPNCQVEFHPSFLKKYLSEEEMERWERLKLKKTWNP